MSRQGKQQACKPQTEFTCIATEAGLLGMQSGCVKILQFAPRLSHALLYNASSGISTGKAGFMCICLLLQPWVEGGACTLLLPADNPGNRLLP